MNTSRFSSCELHNSRSSDKHKDGRAANSRAQATPKRARNVAYTVHKPSHFCLRTTFPPTFLLQTSSSATFLLQTHLLHYRSKVLSTDHQPTNAFSRNSFLLNVLSANPSFASLFSDHLPTNVSSRNNSPLYFSFPTSCAPTGPCRFEQPNRAPKRSPSGLERPTVSAMGQPSGLERPRPVPRLKLE